MCGRNSLFTPLPELEERFDATASFDYSPRYNIAPGNDLAVVRNDDAGPIDQLKWGLLPNWADDSADVPHNLGG